MYPAMKQPLPLYLASSSSSRWRLLSESKIKSILIGHSSSEQLEQGNLSRTEYVLAIAQDKMNKVLFSANMPSTFLVLTADSLVYGVDSKKFFGKPKDLADARTMLRAVRNEVVEIITACCLVKFKEGVEEKRREWVTTSKVQFSVSESDLETYLSECPDALMSAGGGILEGFGAQFLKSIEGSYSGALGLPLFELRQALLELSA